MIQQRSDSVFLAVGIIYLFFNSFLLPDGLLFTTLLTPFFFLSLLRKKGLQAYFVFLIITVVFAVIQLPAVAYLRVYIQSFGLLQCTAIFTVNAYCFFKEEVDLSGSFKVFGTVNLLLLLVSIVALFLPLLRPFLWYEISMSEGLPIIPRLKMFTYEASYYSLIIVPLFGFYLLKKLLLSARTGILFLSLGLSLLLSLSFGVLGSIAISILLLYCFNLKELGKTINLNYAGAIVVILVIVLAGIYWLYPENVFFERLRNIASGKDSSAKGRTTDSFVLAWNIAKMKSVYFGIGPGQLKLIGRDYIIHFYQYTDIPAVTRIPNAVAETLNIYGIAGLLVRFFIIVYLFFKTRVWHNYYRLFLFLFVFLYQFTGSFLFNVAEYIIWALAFSPNVFPQFDKVLFVKQRGEDKGKCTAAPIDTRP